MYKVIAILALLLATGCEILSPERIYEGVRARERANNAGKGPQASSLPDYQNYERERSAAKN